MSETETKGGNIHLKFKMINYRYTKSPSGERPWERLRVDLQKRDEVYVFTAVRFQDEFLGWRTDFSATRTRSRKDLPIVFGPEISHIFYLRYNVEYIQKTGEHFRTLQHASPSDQMAIQLDEYMSRNTMGRDATINELQTPFIDDGENIALERMPNPGRELTRNEMRTPDVMR